MKNKPIETFTLMPYHFYLLRRANVGWNAAEAGAPTIDPKRPYGNGDVPNDVAEILGWKLDAIEDGVAVPSETQRERLKAIHRETEIALQLLLMGCTKHGIYERWGYRDWRLEKEIP